MWNRKTRKSPPPIYISECHLGSINISGIYKYCMQHSLEDRCCGRQLERHPFKLGHLLTSISELCLGPFLLDCWKHWSVSESPSSLEISSLLDRQLSPSIPLIVPANSCILIILVRLLFILIVLCQFYYFIPVNKVILHPNLWSLRVPL